jgi:hypothetical protein
MRDDSASSGMYNSGFDGDIGEIIVYTAVDAEQRASVEDYLRTKWDI